MTEKDFIAKIHKRLAQITIGSSALRNQGAEGLVAITRNYLEHEIVLKDFFSKLPDENNFKSFLDNHTENLLRKYPKSGKSWGAARKSLNLFFRELVYNKFIADHFRLSKNFSSYNKSIANLEIPLDKNVAEGIFNNTKSEIPKWKSIKGLDQVVSDQYQNAAKSIAAKKNIPIIHLDLLYWRPNTHK